MVDEPARIDTRAEIARLQAAGYGPTEIARSLNNRRIPTPTGRGSWWAATVQRHLDPTSWSATMRRYRERQRQAEAARLSSNTRDTRSVAR